MWLFLYFWCFNNKEQEEWVVTEVFEKKLAYAVLRIFSAQTGPHASVHFILLTTPQMGGASLVFQTKNLTPRF